MRFTFLKKGLYGLFVTASLSVSPAFGDGTVIDTGIVYGRGAVEGGSIPLVLDLYRPATGCSEPCPVVVTMHGGGFKSGSRSGRNWRLVAEELTDEGYAVISIDYRLTGDNPVPNESYLQNFTRGASSDLLTFAGDSEKAQQARAAISAFEDTFIALEWLAQNAEQYGFDPTRVALWGSSAGAVIANSVAFGMDELGVSSSVEIRSVVGFWGNLPDVFEVAAGDPAVLIVHGENDRTIGIENAEGLYQSALARGVPVQYFPFRNKRAQLV